MKKIFLLLLALLLAALLYFVAPPAIFLARAWWNDPAEPISSASAGTDDASHLNSNQPAEVVPLANDPVAAERQLGDLVRRAAAEGSHISISGAHHSMGGHTIYPGAIVLDILPFNRISLDEEKRLLTVGSGARWLEIIPYLDQRGHAVAIMQSNNDFTVGGSISVNCHGWQNDSPPIASSVESFRILTADGSIQQCSRTENTELFKLALGGYGLFGVILEVKLHVVPNEFYKAEAHRVPPADYDRVYHELTRNNKDIGMAYGRINVAPNSFLKEMIVNVLRRQPSARSNKDTISEQKVSALKRVVFRAGAGSDYGKNLRWWLETKKGETGDVVISRNQIMNEPSNLYANRDPSQTDILHEYFIPTARLPEFIEKARPVFLKHHPDLLNITVRNVETDPDAFLRYAREEVFGLVMLFNQKRDAAAESAMQAFTQELIETALACGGTYYLPYRAHATVAQFERGYPQAREFFAQKKRFDPAGVFENQFYLNYGKPLSETP